MLRERYPKDKVFEEILQHVPKMDPILAKIDTQLEDENLLEFIKEDLSKRYPKTLKTGRNSTPVEVVIRMLIVKRLYQYSYAETERYISDSLLLRQFCRIYLNKVPDDTTMIRLANQIQPETLEKFNARIVEIAIQGKVIRGEKLRTDGTVVETNIHPPTDSRLLADSIRVLSRIVAKARKAMEIAIEPMEDFTKAARKTARNIGEAMRKRTDEAKEIGKQHYQELLEMTEKTTQQADQVLAHLETQTKGCPENDGIIEDLHSTNPKSDGSNPAAGSQE